MISVIMLTYNREKYVRNMIEDILKQTYTDFEYIIIDNGSIDASGKIADEYARNDKRIRVIHLNKAKSIGYARNLGLKESIGEYIAYVDDDDRVEPDFLDFLMSLIEKHNADISMCGASEGDGTTRNPQCIFNEKMILTGEEALRLLLGRKYIRAGMPTKLYKREILEKYPFVENYKNEDIHTQYKYLLSGKIIVIYGIDKYYIARHAGNISGFTSNAKDWDAETMNDYLTAFNNRTEFVKQHAPDTYKLAMYSEWSFMISMCIKIENQQIENCGEQYHYMKQQLIDNIGEIKKTEYLTDVERKWIEYIKE